MNLKKSKAASVKAIVLSIFAVIVILISAFVYFALISSNVQAQLHVESGIVKVNGQDVSGDTILKQGDVIETSSGLGTVILYESILVSLQPNTKVSLADLTKTHPLVRQESGTTWNKFVHLTGIEEFSIKTSTSLATVRGTAFELSESKLVASEGVVDYVVDGQKFEVPAGDVIERKGKVASRRAINAEEVADVKKHFERVITELKDVRSKEINKHNAILDIVKKRYGVDDAQVKAGLEDADKGKVDVDVLASKSPVPSQSVDKVLGITKEIQKINAEIDKLSRHEKFENEGSDLKKKLTEAKSNEIKSDEKKSSDVEVKKELGNDAQASKISGSEEKVASKKTISANARESALGRMSAVEKNVAESKKKMKDLFGAASEVKSSIADKSAEASIEVSTGFNADSAKNSGSSVDAPKTSSEPARVFAAIKSENKQSVSRSSQQSGRVYSVQSGDSGRKSHSDSSARSSGSGGGSSVSSGDGNSGKGREKD